jgi:transcriptional repressor NrdR
MRCPFCHADKDSLKVIDSRACDGDRAIRRRRECLNCKKRFTTYERIEGSVKLTVVKADGRRVPWDRQKIVAGLSRATFKRKVSDEVLQRIAEEVEEECFASHDREVPTSEIGRLVADRLRLVDQVAYVRFASVYRQFKTLDELIEAAQNVIDAKRFETPGQGRLFIEPRNNGTAAPDPDSADAPAAKKPRRRAKPATDD